MLRLRQIDFIYSTLRITLIFQGQMKSGFLQNIHIYIYIYIDALLYELFYLMSIITLLQS